MYQKCLILPSYGWTCLQVLAEKCKRADTNRAFDVKRVSAVTECGLRLFSFKPCDGSCDEWPTVFATPQGLCPMAGSPQRVLVTLPHVWMVVFVPGWTMAVPPGSSSSCCPESCSTPTMDCLSTPPSTATQCKSAHSQPLWRMRMSGKWTVTICLSLCSSEMRWFCDHSLLI